MADIYLGITIMLALAVAAGVWGYRAARGGHRRLAGTIALACVAILTLHLKYFRHSLWPAEVLPFSNVLVLSDPRPILVGVLVGVGAATMAGDVLRRTLLLGTLAALCLAAAYGNVLGSPPPLANRWQSGVCRQTSSASCGPAAAATLLAAHGIRSSEGEMARLCLTTRDGTATGGIYRGLTLKAAETPWRVEVFHGTVDDLRALDGPVLLSVRLDPGPDVDPRYQANWGWLPGVPHTIVLYRCRDDGRFEVGDPAVGRELWDRRAIETLWHGEGLRLVPR